MSSRQRSYYAACLLAVAGALVVQLFVPPIIGLADNADFRREIGIFSYAAAPATHDLTFAYVAPLYTRQPNVRRADYEQFTSHLLFVAAAVGLSQALFLNEALPITLMGAVHVAFLLAALARLFFVTRNLRGYLLVWAGTAIVLTDVGYAAYANSFFSENASGIFAIWTIAEAIESIERREAGVTFVFASVLLVIAKPQNAPLALPLAAFALVIGQPDRWRKAFPAVALLAAGTLDVTLVQQRPKADTSYNVLFSALLPESRDPRGDLRALALDPELVRFKGTLAWSPNSGLYEREVRAAVEGLGPFRIAAFYLLRPARLWRHLTTLFPVAAQIRPESCGNFTPSAGLPAGARATRFTAWSNFHKYWLSPVAKFLLFGLIALACGSLTLGGKHPYSRLLALLPILALSAFLSAALGDQNEPIKHQYLFNLLLDACILSVLTTAYASQTYAPNFRTSRNPMRS